MKYLGLLLLFAIGFKSVVAQDIIIKKINIISMSLNSTVSKKSVLIQNGKIVAIGNHKDFPKNAKTKVIRGKRNYLMPSLADMHVHLPEENKIADLLNYQLAAGVTHIRVMNSEVPPLELKKKLENNPIPNQPIVHFGHLVTRNDMYTKKQAENLMLDLKKNGIKFIKLLSLSSPETFDNLANAAYKSNIFLCGHYPVYQSDSITKMIHFEKVIRSNFRSIEHLAGYSWLRDSSELEESIALTKEYKMFNCPTLDWDAMAYDLQFPETYKQRITYSFLPKNLTKNWERSYLDDIAASGGTAKTMERKEKYQPVFDAKMKLLKKLYENNCLLLIGGDAGNNFQANGFNIYEEMKQWEKAGIDNLTILKSATTNAALFFNEQNFWGTVEQGKNAELIILKKNPLENIDNITTIKKTIFGNEVYKNRKLIKKLK